jgi:hypothetical protein
MYKISSLLRRLKMNCAEIIKEYLEKNGYDGLFNVDGECGCEINNLNPCGECLADCEPGYKHEDKSGEHDWLICDKPTKEA